MRYQALDGWRGLCALGVALFHFNALGHFYDLDIVRNSWLLVDFFFVLSGFVITTATEDTLGHGRGAGAFLIRRFGRVYPLHFVMLAAFVTVEAAKAYAGLHGVAVNSPAFPPQKAIEAIPTNLLLIQALGIHATNTWNFPSWSISVEFWTYVAFTLVSILTTGRTRTIVLMATMVGAWFVVVACSPHGQEAMSDYGFFRCLAGFLAGYGVATARGVLPRGACGGTAAELGAVAVAGVFLATAGRSPLGFAAPAVFALVVLVFAAETGAVSRLLKTAPLQSIGAWSFSIYMIHAFVLENLVDRVGVLVERKFGVGLWTQIPDVLGGPDVALMVLGGRWQCDLVAIAYLAVVIGLASLSYRFVEVPARNLFRAVADGRRIAAAPARA